MVKARKRFGQHFLTDRSVLARMADCIDPRTSDRLLEIGPGRGALTEFLYGATRRFVAIEIDRDLAPPLRTRFPDLELIVADVLNFNFAKLGNGNGNGNGNHGGCGNAIDDSNRCGHHCGDESAPDSNSYPDLYVGKGADTAKGKESVKANGADNGKRADMSNKPWRIVGNLPYNISTPLLVRLLNLSMPILDMHFMLQRELAQRITAEPGTKEWGRLSVLVRYRCCVERLFDVPPSSFVPPPKVWSCVVRLTPRPETLPLRNRDHFDVVLRTAFSARRKRIDNALKKLPIDWQRALVDRHCRPDQLSVADYVRIANALRDSGRH